MDYKHIHLRIAHNEGDNVYSSVVRREEGRAKVRIVEGNI
jgi:hypothetical protein